MSFINTTTFIVLLHKIIEFHYFTQLFAVNSDECLMTRMQEMSLDYHFTVEQEVGSSTYAFFGFNGTFSNLEHFFGTVLFISRECVLVR